LERRTILELGQCNWIPTRQNIIVRGPTGSGKTFLTCAFGKAAARSGFTVRYHRTSRLLHTLSRVRSDGSLTATQVPIPEWHRRIPDPTLADAILDRLVHNAHRLEPKGESQRKLRAKRTMANT
jgi:DNA replication protein DnaC